MKWVFIALIFVVVLVAAFYAFNNYIYQQKQGVTITKNQENTENMDSQVIPISHATFILNIGGEVIYNDPVGGAEAFSNQKEPSIILISDIHGDHLDVETVQAVTTERTIIVAPQAVSDKLPENLPGEIVVLSNGLKTVQRGIEIEAIPMYNIPESEDTFHTKGRGNGYVLSANGKRIYIAGDTSATPEMKSLENIDEAFIPMNLPYTMDIEEAAEAVVAFKPKVVHPYHYRGQEGFSDINKFKELVESKDSNIKVELLDFYKE